MTGPPTRPQLGGGAQLMDDIETFLSRFVVYPSEAARIAHTLWIAHAWLMDCWESTPRIAFLSPEPGSGKSRALEVTEPLVPRPVHAVNVSPAYLFRKVSDEGGAPTILFDEIDTIFGPRAKDNEDVRGMLNAGHRRGATAGRCVVRGNLVTTEELPSYCAVALAGLDDLPDTIASRSIIVRMRRRAPGEAVEPWRMRVNGPEAAPLYDRLLVWSQAVRHLAVDRWPTMPAGIEDRNADVWEALLSVADVSGGDWPSRARVSAVSHVSDARDDQRRSLGITLLADLHTVFTTQNTEKISTEKIIFELCALDESPWNDLRGKPIDARFLARRLAKYGIKPKTVRIADAGLLKGYAAGDLADPWLRYLGSSPDLSDTADTTTQRAQLTTADVSAVSALQRSCDDCGQPLAEADQLADSACCADCDTSGPAVADAAEWGLR